MKWFDYFLILLIGLMGLEIFLLSSQNRELKTQLISLQEHREPLSISVGDKVSPFTARTLFGDTLRVDYSKKPVLLFVFSTGCPICQENVPYWETLSEKMDDCQVYAVTGEPIELVSDFMQQEAVSYEVLMVDRDFVEMFKIRRVPQMILIDKTGIIVKSFIGPVDTKITNEFSLIVNGE